MSDTTAVRNIWDIGRVVARGLLLRLHDLSTRPPHTLAQHHGPGVAYPAPMDEDVAPGRVAILAMPSPHACGWWRSLWSRCVALRSVDAMTKPP